MPNVVSLKVPAYRRHKASGQAVVRLAGRDVYLGKHGSAASHEAYKRFAAEYLERGGVRNSDDPHDTTVLEVMAAYIRFARMYYRKNGKPTREFELICETCRFIKALYARTRAVDFGPLALKAVRQTMVDAGHCRNHVNKNISRVKRMFKWAAEEEIIPGRVAQALWAVAGLRKGRTEARESVPVQPVDDAIVDATLPHLSTVIADMARVQRLTGCRPAEICTLRPCDIDRSGQIWRYQPQSHKTEHHGRPRTIFFGPRAQGILLPYLARDEKSYCFRPADSEAKRRAAQHSSRVTPLNSGNRPGSNRKQRPKRVPGDRYTASAYRRAIHRACDKAFPAPDELAADPTKLATWQSAHRWSPNRLRHSAATEIRKRFGLEAAQVVLGHSTADITQIYAERNFALADQVAKEVG
jgi:integrase